MKSGNAQRSAWKRNIAIRGAQPTQLWEERQKRRYQRIALEVEVLIVTNGAMLPGRTQEIILAI